MRGRDGATHSWAARDRRRERTGRPACREAPAAARGVDARWWASVLCGRARRRGLGREPTRVGRKLLQVYVSQLRKALPSREALVTTPSGYALRFEPGSLDADRFERLLADAVEAMGQENSSLALSQLDRALALWRGPAYADVMYEDFARAEAERLEELRLAALEARLEALSQLGRNDEVLGEALAMARDHPLRERVQGLAMLALYRAGRQTEALDHYVELRRRLDDELGLEPSVELRELQRRFSSRIPSSRRASRLSTPRACSPCRRTRWSDASAIWRRWPSSSHVATHDCSSSPARREWQDAPRARGRPAGGLELRQRRCDRRARAPARPRLAATDDRERSRGRGGAQPDSARHARCGSEQPGAPRRPRQRRASALRDAVIRRAARPRPRLVLLVTSRAVLHLTGEHVFRSLRSTTTPPSSFSNSVLGRCNPTSRSRPRTRAWCARSAGASTACRSRSSSQPPGSGR